MKRLFSSAVLAVALISVPVGGDAFAAKKPVMAKKPPIAVVQSSKCKGFFQCLFGARKGVRVTNKPVFGNTTVASLGNVGLSGRTSHKIVDWNETKYPVGSLIVRTPERALYYVTGSGEAIRYSVGVGREGMQWSGNSKIVAKQEWPGWTPPQVMIEREAAKGHIIPPHMDGGPGNPLGARAMYIGGTMFRIHGTNNEASIGGAVSSGCIRMMNADVIDLYSRVKVGSRIYVYQ
jgi:lipoprotein-anchoring transpeptidase ErfK/SrfK